MVFEVAFLVAGTRSLLNRSIVLFDMTFHDFSLECKMMENRNWKMTSK